MANIFRTVDDLIRALQGGSYQMPGFPLEPKCPCQDSRQPEFESHSLFCDVVRKNEFWAVNRN